jgi:O-antigen ligase
VPGAACQAPEERLPERDDLSLRRITSFFFLATIFTCTFEKVHWNVAGSVGIADVFAILFLACFVAISRPRVPPTTVAVIGFFAAFCLVYLAGFYDLETSQALAQFAKGLVKFVIHFAFLAAAVAWLWRRGQRYYWRTFTWFCAGVATNALYGVAQLLEARRGGNLDATLLSPITGGASQINIYGAVEGANVYRPNALTGDPNHLGIMLIIPLLLLVPIYLRLERAHPRRRWLALLIVFLLLVEAATLSRSGLLGLGVGALVLAVPYRGYLWSRALLYPVVAALAVLVAIFFAQRHFFTVVLRSRLSASGSSAHFQVYSFIPHVLHSNPLFGLGLNNFSVYYEFVTGKTNWGPHSFYVSLLVETGLVGTALFAFFLFWVFRRLRRARELGRALAMAHDPLGSLVRPLAWGCTAALAGTLASNIFYLTMQFYYFYAFLALALAVPVVFATAQSESPKGVGTGSAARNSGTSRS